MADFPPVIAPEEARDIPRGNLMLIVTGSQGERRAASAQLSRGKYQGLTLAEGDLFLFSSKTIPGNEISVGRIINALSEMGVDVVDDSSGLYHVSGHANRPDLEEIHALMKPQMLIPMHGEHRHLREHVRLAASRDIAGAVVANGTMLDLSGDRPQVVDQIEAGRVYLDGNRLIGAMDGIVRDRIRMALNGVMVISLLIDEEDEASDGAWVETKGLAETGRSGTPLVDELEDGLADALNRAKAKVLADDDALEELLRRTARQIALDEIGRKPEAVVLISRIVAQ